ncbi:hypothetical protein LX36DRAFT_499121 [Colletotrichum falcatum]|nr:hypothetical protein LX36DRAFT_499121 [Colletotrichum falcatum]
MSQPVRTGLRGHAHTHTHILPSMYTYTVAVTVTVTVTPAHPSSRNIMLHNHQGSQPANTSRPAHRPAFIRSPSSSPKGRFRPAPPFPSKANPSARGGATWRSLTREPPARVGLLVPLA